MATDVTREEVTPLMRDEDTFSGPDRAAVNADSHSVGSDDAGMDYEEVHVSVESVDDHYARTTNIQSMMNLIKGNIGTGILAIPSAIMNAGLTVGTLGIVVIGCIAIHAMHMLVNCSHTLCDRIGKRSLDYGGVVYESFRTGPVRLRRLAMPAYVILNVFLCITQLGFCVIYILFIAQNVEQIIRSSTGFDMNVRIYQLMAFVLLVPYAMIRKLKFLAPFSLLANVLTACGLVIIVQWCVRDLKPINELPQFNSWATLPLYFGTAVYAFEGIGVVLPIENKMRTPRDFAGWTGVLNTGMVITTVLYITIGFYGYMRVGNEVEGSITLNLPLDYWLYSVVRLAFALSMFITYGLQFYVPVYIIWAGLKNVASVQWYQDYGEYLLRVILVLLTFLISISVPHLDLMIALVGALSSSAVALIFPPLVDILVHWPAVHTCRSVLRLSKNLVIILFAFLGFFTGTFTTIKEIIRVTDYN